MKTTVIGLVVFCLVAAAAAAPPWSARLPAKSDATIVPRPAAGARQGGDLIADATVIPVLPFFDTGTTAGYNDDYDEVCPYSISTSPDVVYTFFCLSDQSIDIDLCGSLYDTKLYVYDADLNLVACNDDYYFDGVCGVYVSALFGIALEAGMQYYIVIDGYGGDYGDYELAVYEILGDPCTGYCLPGYEEENEPELMDEYVDAYNGGCNSPEFGNPFQALWGQDETETLYFCGLSGWYEFDGSNYRDTDWFTAVIGETGTAEWICEPQFDVAMFQLGPLDCGEVGVLQNATAACMDPGMLTVTGEPGAVVWLWIGPTAFEAPDWYEEHEFEYLMSLTGIQPGPVAVARATWSRVKAMYR
jgi:hypothetical protein